MRFINDFDWKKTMQYGWRRILRALVRPFAALRLKFRRLSNPNTLVNTVVTDVQAEVKKAVSKKPESLEEYLPVGRYYAAKKLNSFNQATDIFTVATVTVTITKD